MINEQNVAEYAGKIAAWIREQVEQAHRTGVVLGMSGGIDCCVTARLCQLAGVEVHLVLMPYGDDMKNTKSSDHSMELIEKFNFPYHVFDIKPAVDALAIPVDSPYCHASKEHFELSRANIRPRVRMTYLYQFAQLGSRFVIGTGNRAERTVGYFTKWGDGACDLNPLAMLTKQEVYTLARYLEVPDCIICKKPSAGLWDGQTDEDELGMTYTQIDAYILSGTSGNPETDRLIERRIAMSAHKHAPIPVYSPTPTHPHVGRETIAIQEQVEDRYLEYDECCKRLRDEYNKYGSLYIAFDFDNTVFDCHGLGDTYPKVEELLVKCKNAGFKLILFTANEGEKLRSAIDYCTRRGYAPDYINESPVMNTRKPYYSLLLDDRAGLGESFKILNSVVSTHK